MTGMTPQVIDQHFPYFIFIYGALITTVLNAPQLIELAERKFPPQLLQQMQGHRWLALFCMVVGFFWSLQNLWFYS